VAAFDAIEYIMLTHARSFRVSAGPVSRCVGVVLARFGFACASQHIDSYEACFSSR